jgi:hypothetical protein
MPIFSLRKNDSGALQRLSLGYHFWEFYVFLPEVPRFVIRVTDSSAGTAGAVQGI